MATEVTKEFIVGMPKAELHLHIEGTLEPELKLKLAQKNHVDIGQTTIEEVRASYQYDDLASFLAVYYPAMNVLQTEDDFYDLAMEYIHHAAENMSVMLKFSLIPRHTRAVVSLLNPSSTAYTGLLSMPGHSISMPD